MDEYLKEILPEIGPGDFNYTSSRLMRNKKHMFHSDEMQNLINFVATQNT